MKWTESKVKQGLYDRYRSKWLAEHGFNLIDVIKKYCEYSKNNNISSITEEEFSDFEDNNNLTESEMWLSYCDWEENILCDELSGVIIECFCEECGPLFSKDYKSVYFDHCYGKLKIELEDGTDINNLSNVAYDIAMALIDFEYEDEDSTPKIISDTSVQTVDKIISSLFYNYGDCEL